MSLGLFGKKEVTETIGIDIGTSSIKIVQLRKEKEKLILVTYGEIELGPYVGLEVGQPVTLDEDKIVEAIKDLMKSAKITCKEASLSLDAGSSYVSVISVPNIPDKELDQIIPIESRKYIPVPVTEVSIDWWHMPSDTPTSESKSRLVNVVIAAVKNEKINNYSSIAKKLELTGVDFEIEGFSIARAMFVNHPGMFICLDIGAQYSTLSLIKSNIVFDTSIIAHGSQESTRQLARSLSLNLKVAEETKRMFGYLGDKSNQYVKEVMELSSYPLFGEAIRLSLLYERKYNKNIEGIILSGGGARLSGVVDVYKKMSHTDTVILASPFDQVVVPLFLKEMIERIGPSYTVALGLALKKLNYTK